MGDSANQVIASLMKRLSDGSTVYIGVNEVAGWPDGLLNSLLKIGLINETAKAGSIECHGCENNCYEPVHFTPDASRAFVICSDPAQQSTIGRISIEPAQLQQWLLSVDGVARAVGRLLGLTSSFTFSPKDQSYALGIMKGPKGRRSVSLTTKPFALSINQHSLMLDELLFFERAKLQIDSAAIEYALQQNPVSTKAYVPNTDRQQARKLETQTMYADWQDEYQRLRIAHPDKPDTWIASRIAKLPMANGKSPETIRKHMKG